MSRRPMPRPRLLRRPSLRASASRRRSRAGSAAAWMFFGASLFATCELAAGLLIGRFFDWGRAEALLFLAFRPWLLLIAAIRVAEADWRRRYGLYALALLAAGLTESLLLLQMGGSDPWPEMIRGWIAGAMLVVLFDLAIQAGSRIGKWRGKLAGTATLAVLLLAGGLRPYEVIMLREPAATETAGGPAVTVMTSLPIIWGEAGAFEAGGGPTAAWLSLQREFVLRPIDFLDVGSLAQARLMLLAQPRQLAPRELVALDEWVRAGGRVLILADPALTWPSALPPGDVRRPVVTNMLMPLLSHWRITVGEVEQQGRVHDLGKRRLLIAGTASLSSRNRQCRQEAPFLLDCRIGRGRAIVVADSDLLHDFTSLPAGAGAFHRHNRLSDNLLAIADWLDRLSGVERDRAAGVVDWADPAANRGSALLAAFLPIGAFLALALVAGFIRRGNSPIYPQAAKGAANARTNHE